MRFEEEALNRWGAAMRTLACTVTLLTLGLLTACGGGGGDSGNNPATTTLFIDAIEDAHTNGVVLTTAGDRHLMGDNAGGDDFRGLVRIPLASIPAGANIVGAFLNISFLDRQGTPAGTGINNLGSLQFVRISGANTLATGDYNAPALALDPANSLAVDLPNTRPRIGLLTPVLSAVASGDMHLTLRLQYQMATNTNGVADQMEFASLDHATEPGVQLEVITQP